MKVEAGGQQGKLVALFVVDLLESDESVEVIVCERWVAAQVVQEDVGLCSFSAAPQSLRNQCVDRAG